MSMRSGRSGGWSLRSPNALPEVTSRSTICQRFVRRRSPGGFWRSPGISRSDPRVNGFEALHDCRSGEPLDAFPRTGSKAGAQVSIIQQPGHGFGELVFIAGRHKKPVLPIHDHIDYSASCGRYHRTATGHRLHYGRRTGIKANRWEHSKKATTKCGHNVIVRPLSAHISPVGKVRRRVWHAPADQQQWWAFPAERFVGPQQRRQAFISGQLANEKEELLLRQARRNVFGPVLGLITFATQDVLVKHEVRYNAGVWARRNMAATGDSVAHAD